MCFLKYVINGLCWSFAVLLNSTTIFDRIFSDEYILDIIGALECKYMSSLVTSYLSLFCIYPINDILVIVHFLLNSIHFVGQVCVLFYAASFSQSSNDFFFSMICICVDVGCQVCYSVAIIICCTLAIMCIHLYPSVHFFILYHPADGILCFAVSRVLVL